MNNALNLHRLRPPPPPLAISGLLLALGSLLAGSLLPLHAQFQSDEFNDSNDAEWTRYNPFASLGANIVRWEFPGGGYRIRTTAPSPNFALAGPGRAGSLRSEVYTNFYVTVDIVNWDDTLPHAAGILARIQTPGLGTTTGYAFTWDRGNPANPTAGDVDFSRINGEAPVGINTTGSDRLHMEPGKSYRFVFIGRGPNFEGRVYELPDTITPKVSVTGADPDPIPYEYGTCGLVIYDNSTGGTNICDITFDNFYVTDIEPPRIKMTDHGFGTWELSWPREASPFVLQSSPVLPGNSQDWTEVIGVQTADDRYWVLVDSDPILGGLPKLFHRLVRPAPAN